MTIKEARKKAGLTQVELSIFLDVPLRTIENWEGGVNNPRKWAEKLIIEKIEKISEKPFKIYNPAVKYYADCCKSFSHDTASWGGLNEFSFYTTDGIGDWIESGDNDCNGINLDWAFHLSDEEIEQRAAEKLFENFEEEIQLAIDDEWSLDDFQHIIDKFNFT